MRLALVHSLVVPVFELFHLIFKFDASFFTAVHEFYLRPFLAPAIFHFQRGDKNGIEGRAGQIEEKSTDKDVQ